MRRNPRGSSSTAGALFASTLNRLPPPWAYSRGRPSWQGGDSRAVRVATGAAVEAGILGRAGSARDAARSTLTAWGHARGWRELDSRSRQGRARHGGRHSAPAGAARQGKALPLLPDATP